MHDAGTPGIAKRVLLAFVGLIVAPILGVWAGGSMPNPPGVGPGWGQLVVGAVVPAALTFAAAVRVRAGRLEAGLWSVGSLAATGGLVLFLVWAIATYIPD